MQALMKLREANTASALPVMWRDVDYRRWSGVRVEAAAVTGL